ncbi:MAG: O-antigen ligase family protein [Rhodobacteraceae bacterium]|nr:O-antigen ligase family protein [Paracoccaceae bacterium]
MTARTSAETAGARALELAAALTGWATLAVVLASSLFLGANRPVTWILLSMMVLALFIAQLLIDALSDPKPRTWRLVPPVLLFLGALLWAVVQTAPIASGLAVHPIWGFAPEANGAISADPIAGRHHVMRLCLYAMVFWIALRAAADPDRAQAFLVATALFIAGLSAFGLYAYMTGNNPILGDLASNSVVSASFGNRNSFATYAVFGLVANLALYLRLMSDGAAENSAGRAELRDFIEKFFGGGWIFVLGVLICAAALLLSQSRAGAGAAIIGILVFILTREREGRVSIGLLATVGFVFAFVVFVLSSGLGQRLVSTSEEESRFEVYDRITALIAERPILGHGLGSFQDVFRAELPLDLATTEWTMAHNSYLENALEFGLVGAAAFYLALAWLGALVLHGTMVRRRHRVFSRVALACFAAAAFHAFFDFSLQIPAIAAAFAMILGIGVAQSQRRGTRNG